MTFPNDWPDWVSTEEGDVVWVRQGVPEVVVPALREARDCVSDGGRYSLTFEGRVAMVRPIDAGPSGYAFACGWSDAPLLYETDDPDPQEAMMYGRFEVGEEGWAP